MSRAQPPLIIDTGSFACRVGVSYGAESDAPSLSIPSLVGRKPSRLKRAIATLKRSTVKAQRSSTSEDEEYHVRNSANPNPKSRFLGGQHGVSSEEARKYLFQSPFCDLDNSVENWDYLEDLWGHAIIDELHMRPDDHPMLIAEPLGGFDMRSRERLLEVMFETFNVPALCLENQMVLSLYSTGRTDGCVLSSGHSQTSAVSVFQGRVLAGCDHSSAIAGRVATEYLSSLLEWDGPAGPSLAAAGKQYSVRSSGSSTATGSTGGRLRGRVEARESSVRRGSTSSKARSRRWSLGLGKRHKSDRGNPLGDAGLRNALTDIKHSMGYVALDLDAEEAAFHHRQTSKALSLSVRDLARHESFFPRQPLLSMTSGRALSPPPGLGLKAEPALGNQDLTYVLPDGTEVEVGSASYHVGELMFRPEMLSSKSFEMATQLHAPGASGLSAQNLTYMAVSSAVDAFSMFHGPTADHVAYERSLWGNVVVAGGTTAFPGYVDRLGAELGSLLRGSKQSVDLVHSASPSDSAWAGGSVLASLSPNSAGGGWISVDDYEAFGAALVHNRCPVSAGFSAHSTGIGRPVPTLDEV